MKRITFNHAQQRWDDYEAFHIKLNNDLFTHFATGEFVCNVAAPAPYQRKMYAEYGIALTASIDGDYGFFSPTGLSIKETWLNYHGANYYMVDLTIGRAVQLSYANTTQRKGLHDNVQRCCAYFLNYEAMPQGHVPCTYSYPDTTAATKEWVKEFSLIIQARAVLMGKAREVNAYQKKTITAKMRELEPFEAVNRVIALEMIDSYRAVEPERLSASHDYFMVKPR